MSDDKQPLLAVPTNIITGFLGAGKTTAILDMLKRKPAEERWAVLINEFGEIGVDGSMVEGQASTEQGVHIREVPGGCLCCATGMPMHIALNQLLSRARPHRLLIEPTGLGHPLGILETLMSESNREVLLIQKTLTLVDARNLKDERYTNHASFQQQVSIADVVVANKEDLYSDDDKRSLEAYVERVCRPGTEIEYTRYGEIPLEALVGSTGTLAEARNLGSGGSEPELANDLPFPESGFISAENKGEGFESIGWRFSSGNVFDRTRIVSFLSGLDVERMKAVFITSSGIFAYNKTRDALTETELDDCVESRIEIISQTIDGDWVEGILACLDL